MKLNTKISLAVAPLIAIPLLIVGLYAYLALEEVITSHSKAQVEDHLKRLYDDYQSKVFFAHFALKSMTNDSVLKQYILIEKEQDRYTLMYKPMLERLKSMQLANPNLYEIRLIMLDGFEEIRVVNESIPNATESESGSDFFRLLDFDTSGYSEFIGLNPDTGENALYVTVPIITRDKARDLFTAEPKLRGYLSVTQNINKQISSALPAPLEEGQLLLLDNSQQLHSKELKIAQHSYSEGDIYWLKQLTVTQWQEVDIQGETLHHLGYPLNKRATMHVLIPNQSLLAASFRLSNFVLLLSGVVIAVSIPLLISVLKSQVLSRIANLNKAIKALNKESRVTVIDSKYDDEIGDLIGAFNQMSADLHTSNEKIHNLAYLDALTALPNRFMFHRNLERAKKQAERDGNLLALFYLDLDNFKYVNDNMGHVTGDHLLQKVADRLRECLRAEDTLSRINPQDPSDNLSRLGGDEFTILIPNLKTPYHARSISQRILAILSEPISIAEHVFYVSVSIGISIWPNDTADTNELIAYADQAMYQAKNRGKNRYKFYSQQIGEQTRERANLEQELYRAIDEKEFTLHYQPIVDNMNYHIQSYEALIRWNSESLGFVSPAKFIPVAEENGSIVRIGEWVVEEVCKQIVYWRSQGHNDIKIGVNLSAQQINSIQSITKIQKILQRFETRPENIYFELTESSVIQNEGNAIKNIEKLRADGYQIALDDFGTGYSSLSYLQKLPIDILKIDRSFICNISDGVTSEVLKAIIDVARALNLKVVAEGIEDQEQLDLLPKEEYVMVQGYLFSRPCPIEEAVKLLEQQKALSGHIASIKHL